MTEQGFMARGYNYAAQGYIYASNLSLLTRGVILLGSAAAFVLAYSNNGVKEWFKNFSIFRSNVKTNIVNTKVGEDSSNLPMIFGIILVVSSISGIAYYMINSKKSTKKVASTGEETVISDDSHKSSGKRQS